MIMRIIYLFLAFMWFTSPVMASPLKADQTAVRVLAYFMVGQDHIPQANVTLEQFEAHMQLLKQDGYNVISLEDIAHAYEHGKSLPAKSVAITFDGGDKSILTTAAPILKRYKFPYTVFVATESVEANDPRYLNWQDIRQLQKTRLISIGLHPETYGDLNSLTPNQIRKKINNATARIRDEGIENTNYFSFPFGQYTQKYKAIIENYNFSLSFGQHSGVSYKGTQNTPLPRFTMTEDYADLDRFQMIIDAMPLPAEDIMPQASVIESTTAIGFSIDESLKDQLSRLSCFVSGQARPQINILDNRVEIRLAEAIETDRYRVNCTLPEKKYNAETTTWRWIGFLFHVNDTNVN